MNNRVNRVVSMVMLMLCMTTAPIVLGGCKEKTKEVSTTADAEKKVFNVLSAEVTEQYKMGKNYKCIKCELELQNTSKKPYVFKPASEVYALTEEMNIQTFITLEQEVTIEPNYAYTFDMYLQVPNDMYEFNIATLLKSEKAEDEAIPLVVKVELEQ